MSPHRKKPGEEKPIGQSDPHLPVAPPTLEEIDRRLRAVERQVGVDQGNIEINGKQVHRIANYLYRLEERIYEVKLHLGLEAEPPKHPLTGKRENDPAGASTLPFDDPPKGKKP
jgi:hypothetical protein